MTETYNHTFSTEVVCTYKGRRYFVRDNGEIYRQCKEDGKNRIGDEKWTSGRYDPRTGYMLLGQERVHRIVCTAYHGEPVEDRNVVDHIDTNRCNNRPENLRWVTKLENTLLNPITRAKIEVICGSIEAFLNNPRLLYGHESENPNFSWMRAVTKEEAQRSLARWLEWAAKPLEERKPKGEGVGTWIYEEKKHIDEAKPNRAFKYVGPYSSYDEHMAAVEEMNRKQYELDYGLKDSLTPGAKQLNWKTPTEFILCPRQNQERDLNAYISNLVKGKPLTKNEYREGSIVNEVGFNPYKDAIFVLTDGGNTLKPWCICRIYLQDGYYVHKNEGSYFTEEDGRKAFSYALCSESDEDEYDDDYDVFD
jgi:hypothetical protein